jgi:hypothetical protein
MTKYRTLTLSELQELEKEFVEFLVINGIPAEDWERIKIEEPKTAQHTIEVFSDVVFDTILKKIRFLEKRDTHQLHLFQCLADQLVLVAMEAPASEDIDFTNPDFLASAMLTPPSGIKVYTSSKSYQPNREQELFQMLQNGCLISDDKLFKALCLVLR